MNEETVTISLEHFKELEADAQKKVHSIAEFARLNRELIEANETIKNLNSRICRLKKTLSEKSAPLSSEYLCDMIDRMDFPTSNIYKTLKDIRVGVFWVQPLSDIDINNIINASTGAAADYRRAIHSCIDHYINKTHSIDYYV